MTRRKINDLALKNRPTARRKALRPNLNVRPMWVFIQTLSKPYFDSFKCSSFHVKAVVYVCVSTNQFLSAILFLNKCERTSTVKRLYSSDTVEEEQIDASMPNKKLNTNCQRLLKA